MSDMVENGSGGGSRTLPPGESHDEYLELCALSATELLNDDERHRLNQHLRSCPSCREIRAQYGALIDAGIPSAVAGVEETPSAPFTADGSLDKAEAALFARLDHEDLRIKFAVQDRDVPELVGIRPAGLNGFRPERGGEINDRLWRGMWWQFAAAILLVFVLGFSVYRIGLHRGAEQTAAAVRSVYPESARAALASGGAGKRAQVAAAPATIRDEKPVVTALRAQMRVKAAEMGHLENEKAVLEQNLASSQSDQKQLQQNSDALNQRLTVDEADLASLQQRISAAGQQDAEDALLVTTLRQQVRDLKTSIDSKDAEIAREQELLDHDQDIRDLMASRNLYIAEVYDVARNGQTKKPFGRVFYTKGKSLIFYAYDLDEQPGIRDSSTFQAWGSHGPDRSDAVNLGIFYEDNAAKKCWILKAENAKALSGIDAVFVTAEPQGGSSRPSGKPLLYAYLRIEPNHP